TTEGVDGKFAWLMVFVAFMVQFALFGTIGSFGVYLGEYLQKDFNDQSSTLLAFIGSLGSGVYSISCIPAGILVSKFGHRKIMLIGAFLFGFGLIIASFATKIWLLFLGQSILLGVGASFTFIPAISIVPQWFDKQMGIGVGICAAGSGVGGLIISPIIQAINNQIGWRWALRINGIFSVIVLCASAIVLKPRVPFKSHRVFDSTIVLDTKFIALWGQGAISCFAFWVPFFLMPLYCQYYGISATSASLMIGLMNGSAALGRVGAGLVAQYIGNINTLFFNNLICSLTFPLIWYFSTTTWSLILFSLIFGFLTSALFTNSALITPKLFSLEKLAQVNGLFYTCCAPGYLVGTVIATSIIDASTEGSYINYLPCMMYLFGCYLASCLCLIWLR
ncbi:MFS general substrate transporter, partial [Conidiobolus coronatus NRRL 28638]